VKTLDMSILGRLSRLDMNGSDSTLDAPSQVVATAYLRPIV
jgi:hypothetical protein